MPAGPDGWPPAAASATSRSSWAARPVDAVPRTPRPCPRRPMCRRRPAHAGSTRPGCRPGPADAPRPRSDPPAARPQTGRCTRPAVARSSRQPGRHRARLHPPTALHRWLAAARGRESRTRARPGIGGIEGRADADAVVRLRRPGRDRRADATSGPRQHRTVEPLMNVRRDAVFGLPAGSWPGGRPGRPGSGVRPGCRRFPSGLDRRVHQLDAEQLAQLLNAARQLRGRRPRPGPADSPAAACSTRSSARTPRSTNSSSGRSSSRAPTPYSEAARCLHRLAWSGQSQLICISLGFGNRPCSRSVTTRITSSGSSPRSRPTSDPIRPVEARTTRCQ